jgi:peroxiredoxin (alkyl hydroperoxide reductase subunit C)
MNDSIEIGKLRPNLLLVGSYKTQLVRIRLSYYQEKKYILLVFYPANFTSVSSLELTPVSDKIHEFRQLSIQILVVSVDSPFYSYSFYH